MLPRLVFVTAAVKAPRALATSPVGAGRSSAEFIAAAIRIVVGLGACTDAAATTSAKMAGTTNRASFFTKNPLNVVRCPSHADYGRTGSSVLIETAADAG